MAMNTEFLKAQNIDLTTSTLPKDLKSEWLAEIDKQLVAAEEAESGLSYVSACGTEEARKLIGSYYTPIDVARFFWCEFFDFWGIQSPAQAERFLRTHKFVEPSVGAGALFFALLEKLASAGAPPELLAIIDAEFVDINDEALKFVRERIGQLENAWGLRFANLRFIHQDFRDVKFDTSDKPRIFFGNPPFVTNPRGASRWKNLFADFVEVSLSAAGPDGAVHYILPLSLAFSRDYQDLRRILRERRARIQLSHFDNIPDTLFKSGKPLHTNTNKANSQRCTLLSVVPGSEFKVVSTPLLRWSKGQRSDVLGKSPQYFDVSAYAFDDQFPRPRNERVLHYLEQCKKAPRLGSLIERGGSQSVLVAGVARNYIGIRATPGSGVHDLQFDSKDDALKAIAIISSDLFFDYWLSVGDGFHLTKSNILEFPVHSALQQTLSARLPEFHKTWRNRKKYQKSKLNSGHETKSYDFSDAFPSLYISRVF
ncbi:hypothetical protein [Aliiroseovarius sp. YM-037]|uniref:hypothetical protein n=1 Tax=Aliiroseovarius sp. YM-037 TaxID=3341728 RepID=UPI003A813C11